MSRWIHGVPSGTNSSRNAAARRPCRRRPWERRWPGLPPLQSGVVERTVDRQAQNRFSAGIRGSVQRVEEDVVVGEDAGVAFAQRRHAGAGERRHVDDARGMMSHSVGDGVAQDEASFGIGVGDFYALAAEGDDHIIHGIALWADFVFRRGDDGDQVLFQLQAGGELPGCTARLRRRTCHTSCRSWMCAA